MESERLEHDDQLNQGYAVQEELTQTVNELEERNNSLEQELTAARAAKTTAPSAEPGAI